MKIIDVPKFNNYIKQVTKKNKIVVHGTASGTSKGSIDWLNGPAGKGVSVHFVIDRDGTIYRLFPQQYFAYHAGGNFRNVSKTSFGIQIVNWINLTKKNGQYYTWTNKKIDAKQVITTNMWRGSSHFQSITQAQHKSLQYLLSYLCQKYSIPKKLYRDYDVKSVNFEGIMFHSTFHPQKMDFEPSLIPPIRI